MDMFEAEEMPETLTPQETDVHTSTVSIAPDGDSTSTRDIEHVLTGVYLSNALIC